jgi:hypothetical protein
MSAGWVRRHLVLTTFLLALAVRIAFNVVFVIRTYEPVGDAWDYTTIAQNVIDGKGYAALFPDLSMRPTARRPPLFPLFLAGCFAFCALRE